MLALSLRLYCGLSSFFLMFIAIGLTVALGYANDDQETAPAEGSTAASFPCGRQYNEFVLLHQTNDDPSVLL